MPTAVRAMQLGAERAMIMARDASAIGARHLPEEMGRGGVGIRRAEPVTLRETQRRHDMCSAPAQRKPHADRL